MKLRCPRCNTLVDTPAYGAPVCPRCGFGATAAPASPSLVPPAQQHYGAARPAGQTTDGMAVAALVLGITGILVFPLLSLLAIVFGAMSLSKIKKQRGLAGRGMAIAGLVLGILAVVAIVIAAIVFILVATAVGSS